MNIQDFLKTFLPTLSMKKGVDYKVYKNRLWIKKTPLRGKVMSTLKALFPEFNFYFDNPKMLVWF